MTLHSQVILGQSDLEKKWNIVIKQFKKFGYFPYHINKYEDPINKYETMASSWLA